MNYLDIMDDMDDQLRMFSYSFIVWFALFGVIYDRVKIDHFTDRKQIDIYNRIISILHGQFTFWSACYILLVQQPNFHDKNTYRMQLVMLVSSGYFLYDVLVCFYYDLYDYWLVFHHVVSLVAFAQSLISKSNGAFIIYGILLTEISNLPMHARYIIGQFGLRFTKIYESVELLYFGNIFSKVGLFLTFRGVMSPILLVMAWSDINAHYLIKCTASGLMVYSIYYFFEMIKIIKRKIRHQKERNRRKLSYNWFSVNPEITRLQWREKIDPIL